MKKTLLSLTLLFPLLTFSQDLPKNANGQIEYSDVVKIDSTDAQTLYSRAKMVIAQTFVSARDVTQLADDNTKSLVVRANIHVVDKSGDYGRVAFVMTIQCKDGRYRYIITDFVQTSPPSRPEMLGGSLDKERPIAGGMYFPMKWWRHIKTYTDTQMNTIIAIFEKSMKGGSEVTKDW